MTNNPLVAGLIAGGVAALLYLSIATGSAMGLLLFYLAPLPGFIAGFGWGVRAATTAAIAGTALVFASMGLYPSLAYGISLALPAVVATRFAFLYRLLDDPDKNAATDTGTDKQSVEWYPVGNLVLIMTAYGGALSMFTVLLLGPSYEAYVEKIGSEIDIIVGKASEAGFFKKLKPEDVANYKTVILSVLPASTAILWSLLSLVNMWIAAHIVRLSQMLSRPWPDLARIEFPAITPLVFVILLILSVVLSGIAKLVVSGFLGALALAFMLLGLAVAHYVSRPWPVRGLFLFTTYVAVFFAFWGAPLLVAVGLVEPLAQIRRRFSNPPIN